MVALCSCLGWRSAPAASRAERSFGLLCFLALYCIHLFRFTARSVRLLAPRTIARGLTWLCTPIDATNGTQSWPVPRVTHFLTLILIRLAPLRALPPNFAALSVTAITTAYRWWPVIAPFDFLSPLSTGLAPPHQYVITLILIYLLAPLFQIYFRRLHLTGTRRLARARIGSRSITRHIFPRVFLAGHHRRPPRHTLIRAFIKGVCWSRTTFKSGALSRLPFRPITNIHHCRQLGLAHHCARRLRHTIGRHSAGSRSPRRTSAGAENLSYIKAPRPAGHRPILVPSQEGSLFYWFEISLSLWHV